MISQHIPSEAVVVLTPNDIKLPEPEKPKPTRPGQDSLVKQLMTEIKVLGTIQIVCGLMVLSLGLIFVSSSSPQFTPAYSTLLKSTYPFLGAFCFVISGFLSIITEKKSVKTLVQSSLATNFLSCLFAVVGFILLSMGLVALGHASRQCDLDKEVMPSLRYNRVYDPSTDMGMACFMATTIVTGLMSIMLIFTVLEFSLAVLGVVLWWKQACSNFLGVDMNKPKMPSKMTSGGRYEEL
ncbi:membrane-spanning 4-domains subfamily A member 6A-like isoform X1 [Loxodonta africana]|nr:membrane-spanning 4-domains subfamily A member 6A-like isoform X1 [Loxodonta africana]XP_023415482.1 membrane-spanning 4-domains subfamily A member 6A-like isoform X1 [Loxodonta africana]XP_023415483.1 membrane-spanning 4-domains subfamily A member 6A-like isoform X1 [Loxodonta africana]